ncbi:hypothetical protein [Christiangramia echinicola]|uniref:hypothetical protein n=1 Tax=Christiangramia echinicola TaxID=279359 RepID=UPI00040719B2|nr:hypothetical protein [Christiangramia echinicola]
MKKFLLLGLTVFCLSCSVENDEINELEISEVNLITSVDGCAIYELQFADEATLEVRNFYDYLEVSVINLGENQFNSLSIHFAETENEFPRTGKGDLNASKFYYSQNVDKGTNEVKVNFTFDELGLMVGDEILITSIAEFGSGKNKSKIIATDSELTDGTYYFEYLVEEFKYYAGNDHIREITLSDAVAIPSWDEVRKLYAGMLDPGVPKKAGDYNPSIWDIINDFNDPNRASKVDDYTTTYTLGSGECSDSVELTLKVVPDPL